MRTIQGKTTWYHANGPTSEDIAFLEKEFSLSPESVEELKSPSTRQKTRQENGSLYAVIKFPLYEQRKKTCRAVEVDVLLRKNAIATVSYEKIIPIEESLKQAETLEGFKATLTGKTGVAALQIIFSALLTYGARELAHIDKNISDVTERIYAGKEKQMIQPISLIKRDVLDFRRILKPMEGTLKEMRDACITLFEEKKQSFENILGAYHDLFDIIDNQKDTIESLETTNQTLIASRIGEVSKILAVATFLLAPFTIVGTLFQINTQFTPIIGIVGDWWIIAALIATGCIALYAYFKKRGWL